MQERKKEEEEEEANAKIGEGVKCAERWLYGRRRTVTNSFRNENTWSNVMDVINSI